MKQYKILGIVLSAALLCGCGASSKAPEVSEIELAKDGKIVSTLVDSFDQDYYDLAELQKLIDEEVAEYRTLYGEEAISAGEATLEDGIVRVCITYADADDYNRFNDRNLFVGTVGDALNEGYSFGTVFHAVSDDEESINSDNIAEHSDLNVIITDEPGRYRINGKIRYISDDVVTESSKAAMISADMEGLCYILYK